MRAVLFLIALMVVGCSRPIKEDEATYHHYNYLFEEVAQNKSELKGLWDNLHPPVLSFDLALDSGWIYMLGSPLEGLNTGVIKVDGERVNLPHRVNEPDHPLWYVKTIDIPSSGVLEIHADDGAQIFVDGVRTYRLNGNFFPINTHGKIVITVRVLNNAMFGGLRTVRFSNLNQYHEYLNAKKEYEQTSLLVQKVILKKSVSDVELKLASQLARHRDGKAMDELKSLLSRYPYFVGPYLIQREDTLSIMCVTDSDSRVELLWGDNASDLSNRIISQDKVNRFDIDLSNLENDFFYKITSGESSTGVIRVNVNKDSRFSFNVWADSQTGWKNFNSTIELINSGADDFGVAAGDLVAEGCDSVEWTQFYSLLSEVAREHPYFLIPGNHDYDGYYDSLFSRNYSQFNQSSNYRSWTYKNAAFIGLDPNVNFPIGVAEGSDQYNWLQSELKKEGWQNAKWRFVFIHQPPFSQGWEGYHGDQVIMELLEPLIEKSKIDFIVCGHTHDYERWIRQYGEQKVTFLITGGAGGSLEDGGLSTDPVMDKVIRTHHIGRFTIEGDSLSFEAIDHTGKVIDSFRQTK